MTKTLKELQEGHPEWCFTCGKYWLEPGGIHTCHESPLLAALITAEREDEARIEELEEALTSIEEISNECDQQRTASERCYEIRTYARAALKGGQP